MPDPADDQTEPAYRSLYRRFRPGTFAEVRGQDHVVLALRNAVRDGRVAHAYLFSGPRGTGKTSTARILAKALNCEAIGADGEPCGTCTSCVEITRGTSLDVHELDAASNNGVDAMRDLVSRAALGTPGRQKVYIVDEVHMLSTAASNALLKTLEEPPAHVVFVLATTDPQKVLPTIRSRTQHYEFRLLAADTLEGLLTDVRAAAGLDVTDDALSVAVRRGRGSARDTLTALDQLAASDDVDDDLPELDEVLRGLGGRDTARVLTAVAHLTAAGWGPQQLTTDLVEVLRQGFLAKVAPDLVSLTGAERETVAQLTDELGVAAVVRAMEVLGRAQVQMRDAPDPRVNLEVALVRLSHPDADDSPEALLARIERLERGAPAAPAVPPMVPPAVAAPVAPIAPIDPGTTPALGAFRRQPPTPAGEAPLAAAEGPARNQPAPEPAPTPEAGPAGEAPPPSAPSGPLPTRDELVEAWGDHIIGRLRPKSKALLVTGRFVAVDGGAAVFALPNEIHRQRCEEVRPDAEAALAEHFGVAVPLRLVVDEGRGEGGGPGRASTSGNPTGPVGPPARSAGGDAGDGADEDLAAFDEADAVGAPPDDPEARVLEAFPGAEEVS